MKSDGKIKLLSVWNSLIWLLILFFMVVSNVDILYERFGLSSIRLFLFVDLLLVAYIYIVAQHGKIRIRLTSFHFYLLTFSLFCFLSSSWAMRPASAIEACVNMLKVTFVMALIFNCYQDSESVDTLLKLVMFSGYGVMAAAIVFYGIEGLRNVLLEESRITNEMANSNNLGIAVAHAVIVNGYYLFYRKKKWWNFLIIPGVIVVAASGSKTALFVMLSGVSVFFILKNMNGKNILYTLIKLSFAILIVAILLFFLLQLPIFAGITIRLTKFVNGLLGGGETDSSTRIRMLMMKTGLSAFASHPLLGIGIDNPQYLMRNLIGHASRLHNNYAEILGGGGMIGFILYYGIYISLLKGYIKMRNFSNGEYNICLALLATNFVKDFGAVSYRAKLSYLILLTCYLNLKILKERQRERGFI